MNKLVDIKLNGVSVNTKLSAMELIVKQFNDSDLGGALDALSNTFASWNIGAITSGVQKMQELSNELDKLVGIEVNGTTVNTKLSAMELIIQQFNDSNLGGALDALSNTFANWNISAVTTGVQKMQSLATELNKLNGVEIDGTAVNTKLSAVELVILQFQESDLGGAFDALNASISGWNISAVTGAVNKMIALGNKLNELSKIEVPTNIKGKIKAIKDVLNDVKEGTGILSGLGDAIAGFFQSSSTGNITKTVDEYIKIGHALINLGNVPINPETSKEVIKNINGVIEQLGTNSMAEWLGTVATADDMAKISASINGYITVSNAIKSLGAEALETEVATKIIDSVNEVIQAMGSSNMSESIANIMSPEQLQLATNSLNSILGIIPLIGKLANGEVNAEGAIATIDQIKTVLSSLSDMSSSNVQVAITGLDTLMASMNNLITTGGNVVISITAIQTSLASLVSSLTSTDTAVTATATNFETQGTAIQETWSNMSAGVISITQSMISQLISLFDGMNSSLYSAGVSAMEGLASGIQEGANSAIAVAQSTANKISDILSDVRATASKISSVSASAGSKGKSHASGLERVPYDGYQATLHKNERVLTPEETKEYENGGGNGNKGISVTIGDVHIHNGSDPEEIALYIARRIRELT